jgi:hypothetical protein
LLDMTEVAGMLAKTPRAARAWLLRAGVPLQPRNARVRLSVLERLLNEAVAPESRRAPTTKNSDDERAAAARDHARDVERIYHRAGGVR